MKTRQLTQWGMQIARACDKSDRCQPGARLVNPRQRLIITHRHGLPPGPLLQRPRLLALFAQLALGLMASGTAVERAGCGHHGEAAMGAVHAASAVRSSPS